METAYYYGSDRDVKWDCPHCEDVNRDGSLPGHWNTYLKHTRTCHSCGRDSKVATHDLTRKVR